MLDLGRRILDLGRGILDLGRGMLDFDRGMSDFDKGMLDLDGFLVEKWGTLFEKIRGNNLNSIIQNRLGHENLKRFCFYSNPTGEGFETSKLLTFKVKLSLSVGVPADRTK